jgi:hypothetical protein
VLMVRIGPPTPEQAIVLVSLIRTAKIGGFSASEGGVSSNWVGSRLEDCSSLSSSFAVGYVTQSWLNSIPYRGLYW